ncbi:MAG: hypothetical protein M1820_003908 [Bogoriella megaspora]|nr:MAG: hypothetical protein M1820_003908 [Bogoriella megaspora]
MANPMNRSPERSASLQKYLALHSQQTRIRDLVRRHSYSLSPPISPGSQSISSLSSSPISPPTFALSPFSPHAISTIPEEVEVPQDRFDEEETEEQKLYDINKQIKSTLTDLLNCDSTKQDTKFRVWVQTRLMDAETELRRHRRRRLSIGRGREGMADSIAGSFEY